MCLEERQGWPDIQGFRIPFRCSGFTKKVGDSDDVVTRKLGLSIVDTHVPAIAMTLSPFSWIGCRTMPQRDLDINIWPHRNQILLGGRRQGGRRLLAPDLQSRRISRQPLGGDAGAQQETYIDCRDVHDYLSSVSSRLRRLGNEGSGGGHSVGRPESPDDGEDFEPGHIP
jgi:hypothetical protein